MEHAVGLWVSCRSVHITEERMVLCIQDDKWTLSLVCWYVLSSLLLRVETTHTAESQGVGAGTGHVGVHPCHYQLAAVSTTTTDALQKHSARVTASCTERSQQPLHH